mgnify:CR=1 FL=1
MPGAEGATINQRSEMKGFAETVLGVLVMILALVAVYEFTIIRTLKEQVKAKDLVIDAATLRNRNLQEEMIEKDKTIKLLASPDTLLIR